MFPIIATLGQDSFESSTVWEFAEAGASVLRLNLAPNLGWDEYQRRADMLQEASSGSSRTAAIMFDLPIPKRKIRLGMLPERTHSVAENSRLRFKSGYETDCIISHVPVDFPDIGSLVEPGEVITIGDGEVAVEVLEICDRTSFEGVVRFGGIIGCAKSINTGHLVDSLHSEEAIKYIDFVLSAKPDIIAFSFVEDEQILCEAIEQCCSSTYEPLIAIKIETALGAQRIDRLARHADLVIVARGDLALFAPPYSLGQLQRTITQTCVDQGIPVFVSTQVAESFSSCYVPKRCELADIDTIIRCGASGIMLAGETSKLPCGARTVTRLSSIAMDISREIGGGRIEAIEAVAEWLANRDPKDRKALQRVAFRLDCQLSAGRES